MRKAHRGLALALAVVLPAAAATPAVANSCAGAIEVLDRRMETDGFWFGGYRASHNWTGVSTPLGSEPNLGSRGGLAQLGGPEAAGIAPALPGTDPERRSPFAGLDWRLAPARALRTLLGAAQILAQSGREGPCRAVLAETERDYTDYLARLREAGIEPYELRSWRQKQLIMALPVTDAERPLPVAAVDGMELRNLADELLGAVTGSIMDNRGNDPAFVVIPGDAVMALMLGALIIQGIQPGPRLMTEYPELFWGLIASFWIGNILLVILNIPLIGLWVRMLRIPYSILYPAILLFICIGVFSINNSHFDVLVVMFFGVVGYGMILLRFEPAPLLLGFILGPLMEEHLRRAMLLSRGDLMVFWERPISAVFLSGTFLLLGWALVATIRGRGAIPTPAAPRPSEGGAAGN